MNKTNLINSAKKVLAQNWKGHFTIPCSKLYPFQWNWDSGFVSFGLGHFNLKYAIQEIESLFSGQWQNGMIPHIIFHSENETTYFPNHEFWETHKNTGAPQKPKTSGITQPPVYGFAIERLLDLNPDNEELIAFTKSIFPKLVHAQRFFYNYRDPQKEGLAFIYHPWESGRDNSPLWDESLERIKIDPGQLPKYERKDIQQAEAAERPTASQYDRYVYLLELGKKNHYDGDGIALESPVLIQDSLINAMLIKSNQSLIRIGKRFGFDTGQLEEWQQQSLKTYREKLWNESLNCFTAFDSRGNYQIAYKEIGGIAPLFAEIPTSHQAALINNYLVDLHNRGYYICPSFDVDDPLFDSKRYWRGPVWPQMNWMIYHGLIHYGYDQTAEIIKSDLISLVEQLGFYEYFESQKSLVSQLNRGYGGNHFSWTASSVLDLIQ